MMDKWLKDPASVGDASTSGGEVKILAIANNHNLKCASFQVTVNIIENSGEFVAIKV